MFHSIAILFLTVKNRFAICDMLSGCFSIEDSEIRKSCGKVARIVNIISAGLVLTFLFHREKKAMERVKKLRDNKNLEQEEIQKHHHNKSVHAMWHEIGEELEENVVEPLKHWSGKMLIQHTN